MKQIQRSIGVAVAALTVAIGAEAQQLPDARAVLARYAKEVNAEKLATVPGYRAKGTFQYPAANLNGAIEIYRDGAGRYVQIVSLPGIGILKEGLEADFKWSMNSAEGPKVTEGQEFIEARERIDPRGPKRDPSLIVDATTVERTTVDGQGCVKVKLTWKSGRKTTDCYSDATGLLVSMESSDTSSMGRLTAETIFSDYKTVDGVKVATKVVQKSMGFEVTQLITEIVFEALDPAKLALPAEIQALRKK